MARASASAAAVRSRSSAWARPRRCRSAWSRISASWRPLSAECVARVLRRLLLTLVELGQPLLELGLQALLGSHGGDFIGVEGKEFRDET
jgi:hypothetical protein